MLSVGSVEEDTSLVLAGTYCQPTHPPTHTHRATIHGFFVDTNRVTVDTILRLVLEHRANERTANAVV